MRYLSNSESLKLVLVVVFAAILTPVASMSIGPVSAQEGSASAPGDRQSEGAKPEFAADPVATEKIGAEKASMVHFLSKNIRNSDAATEPNGNGNRNGGPESGPAAWEASGDYFVFDGLGSLPSESTMAISPNDPNIIVGGFNDDSTGIFNMRIVRSTTGGIPSSSWIDEGTFGAAGENTFDPVVTVDSTGKFYYVGARSGATSDILFRSSTDGGDTWSALVTVLSSSTNFLDKPWAEADMNTRSPFRDNLYVCWTNFAPSGGTDTIQARRVSPTGVLGPVVTLDSVTAATVNSFIQGCYVEVDQNGRVLVAWMEMTGPSTGVIRIRASLNGATSFGATFTVATFDRFPVCGSANGCVDGDDANLIADDIRVDHFPRVATDRLGGIHVVYADNNAAGGTGGDVMYTRATAGFTFSAPITASTTDTGDQWQPSIAVSDIATSTTSRGIIHVMARDRATTGTDAWDYMNYHCDPTAGNGLCSMEAGWSSVDISAGINTNLGFFYTGDYDQIVGSPSLARQAFAIWTDTFNGDYDIYFDRTTT